MKIDYKNLTKGLIKENPTFVMMLGLCPTLAVTTYAINGLGMGVSTAIVLVFSNILIALLRNVIPANVRIPAYIMIIATFVSVIELLLKAYMPPLYNSLGIFIPLIVVNCIILGRAESYASKNHVINAALDGIGIGIAFSLTLLLIAVIREAIGYGTITLQMMGFGWKWVLPTFSNFKPIATMVLPPGAFITIGLLMALRNKLTEKNN